jgi:hypothetical protein
VDQQVLEEEEATKVKIHVILDTKKSNMRLQNLE